MRHLVSVGAVANMPSNARKGPTRVQKCSASSRGRGMPETNKMDELSSIFAGRGKSTPERILERVRPCCGVPVLDSSGHRNRKPNAPISAPMDTYPSSDACEVLRSSASRRPSPAPRHRREGRGGDLHDGAADGRGGGFYDGAAEVLAGPPAQGPFSNTYGGCGVWLALGWGPE